MIKKSVATMLAVAAISLSAVNSFATEAGVLGLKPSANQVATQSSGNTSAASTDAQSVQYDTSKYKFPAQQLKAENKTFDATDWHLYQRFDNGQLMYYQWAEDTGHIIEEGRPNSSGMGKQYGIEGLRSLEPLYANPEGWEREVTESPEVDGYRDIIPDKIVVFESKRTDQFGLRIQLETPVFSNPELTYCQAMTVILPTDFDAGVGMWDIFYPKQKYEFQAKARAEGKLKHVYSEAFFSLKRNVTNVRLYRDNQNEVLYISTDQLDNLRTMMQFTATKPFGQLHKEIKNYGFIDFHSGTRLLW